MQAKKIKMKIDFSDAIALLISCRREGIDIEIETPLRFPKDFQWIRKCHQGN